MPIVQRRANTMRFYARVSKTIDLKIKISPYDITHLHKIDPRVASLHPATATYSIKSI